VTWWNNLSGVFEVVFDMGKSTFLEQKVTKRWSKNGHFWALLGSQYDDFHSKLQKWVEKGVILGYLLVTFCSKNVDFPL
jgi:hypothetical protein